MVPKRRASASPSPGLGSLLLVLLSVLGPGSLAHSQVLVQLRLVDQHQVEIPGSEIRVGSSIYATGTTASLAVGQHTFRLDPGILGRVSHLHREQQAEITPATTQLTFEWITNGGLELHLRDQHDADIPGSVLFFENSTFDVGLFATGATVQGLPITDETVYPGLFGDLAAGYRIRLTPGILGAPSHLNRVERGEVSTLTAQLGYQWITNPGVELHLKDQHGADIPGSELFFENSTFAVGLFATGATVRGLPITDEGVYPGLFGDLAAGYRIRLTPGILGAPSHLNRVERGEVSALTVQLDYQWITNPGLELHLKDQHGADIPGSQLFFENSTFAVGLFATGATVRGLPITDEGVYSNLAGDLAAGYRLRLIVGIPGHAGALVRSERGEVQATTTELAFEWIRFDCPLRLVDALGQLVPGSTLVPPFTPTVFPITENAVYPTLGGVYADGYPIRITPGDQPTLTETFAFEVLASGLLLPAQFQIGARFYSLICQANRPPSADAGPNVQVASSQLATTVVAGNGSDPDQDALTYRWLEGATLLLGPAPVVVAGSAPLPLNGLALGLGPHTLTLEVSDGQLVATSTMVLTIGNSPPVAVCTGAGAYELGRDAVVLRATVSDHDGDAVSYQWKKGTTLLTSGAIPTIAGGTPVSIPDLSVATGTGPGQLGLGAHVLTLTVSDGSNPPIACDVQVLVQDTEAPTLAPTSNAGILWPPNGKMVDVVIQANARDATSGPLTLTATVTSTEDPLKNGAGHTIPDWTEPVIDQTTGVLTLQLRAERSGTGPGRTYTVRITARDASANESTSSVTVRAPHDRG